jgi:hypothetical protein
MDMRTLTKASLLALAAVLMAGASDTAFAARKKHRTIQPRTVLSDQAQRQRDFDRELGIRYDENGVPIIMQGFSSRTKRGTSPSAVPDEEQPKRRADRPRPRGSGAYIPPVNPSPNAGPTPQQILNQQTAQPYKPPPINTFSDRVGNCIHSFPLNAGIGNNPRDQQSYIRQCAN